MRNKLNRKSRIRRKIRQDVSPIDVLESERSSFRLSVIESVTDLLCRLDRFQAERAIFEERIDPSNAPTRRSRIQRSGTSHANLIIGSHSGSERAPACTCTHREIAHKRWGVLRRSRGPSIPLPQQRRCVATFRSEGEQYRYELAVHTGENCLGDAARFAMGVARGHPAPAS